MPQPPREAEYFPSAEAFRGWLERHHADRDELWVGFHRVATGQPSLTWREAVDEALCFGWIDGVRKRVDDTRHVIRFTPRRPRSIWSAVNIARVEALEAEGRMRDPGRAAFARRDDDRSRIYSHERADARLDAAMERRFQDDAAAWAFWNAQPPGYRRTLSWWVISAKRPETRSKRLDELIRESGAGRRVGQFERPSRAPSGESEG
jgi:uncharacterized protein YdeI (YjbR/CyaY-like superfamily)